MLLYRYSYSIFSLLFSRKGTCWTSPSNNTTANNHTTTTTTTTKHSNYNNTNVKNNDTDNNSGNTNRSKEPAGHLPHPPGDMYICIYVYI